MRRRPVDVVDAEFTDYFAEDDNYTRRAHPQKTRKTGWLRLLKWPVYIGLGLGMGFLLFNSFGLFQIAFRKFGLGAIASTCGALQPFPLFGGLLEAGCASIANVIISAIALVSLIALTITESLPVIVYFHPSALSEMVDQLRWNKRNHQPLEVQPGDTPEVERLVERHRNISEGGFRTLVLFSIVAFVVECLICFVARGWHAPLPLVLMNSVGFELLLIAVLSYGNAFRPKPARKVRDYVETY